MKNTFDTIVAKERVDLGKNVPTKYPWLVVIEPSGYCNFKCSFILNVGGV